MNHIDPVSAKYDSIEIAPSTLSVKIRGFVASPGVANYGGSAVGYAISAEDFVGHEIRGHQIIAAHIEDGTAQFLVGDEMVAGHMIYLFVLPAGAASEKLGWKGTDKIGHWEYHTLGAEALSPRDW